MKACDNFDAGFTMFILISPPPVLNVCVIVWYCGITILRLVPDKSADVIELPAELSNETVSHLK